MGQSASIGLGKLTGSIFVLVLLGTPLVAYLWETLNRLFSGHVEWGRLALAIPLSVALILLLRWIATIVQRWEGERQDVVHREEQDHDAT